MYRVVHVPQARDDGTFLLQGRTHAPVSEPNTPA